MRGQSSWHLFFSTLVKLISFKTKIYFTNNFNEFLSFLRCPPCRGFTPKLAEFYKQYHVEKNFEIIYVSSDRDQEQLDGE